MINFNIWSSLTSDIKLKNLKLWFLDWSTLFFDLVLIKFNLWFQIDQVELLILRLINFCLWFQIDHLQLLILDWSDLVSDIKLINFNLWFWFDQLRLLDFEFDQLQPLILHYLIDYSHNFLTQVLSLNVNAQKLIFLTIFLAALSQLYNQSDIFR